MSKRVLSIIFAVVLVAIPLAGCGIEQSSVSVAPAPASSAAPAAPSSAGSAPAQVLKISFGSSDNHPITAYLKLFEADFEKATNGRYDVQIYTSATLGDDLKATEAVKAGQLDAVVTTAAPVTGIIPELFIFDLPFLFKSTAEADKVLLDTEFSQWLDAKMTDKGLLNLAWLENGFRMLTTSDKEVHSPEDVKGLKIRTMENQMHLAAWKALGANPTPMPFSEVFTALQQHVIDGQENPIPTIYDAKFQEVQSYIALTGHVYSPYIFLWSKRLAEKMPAEDVAILEKCAKDLRLKSRELTREAASKNLEAMKAEKINVVELTDAEKEAFKKAVEPVWSQFTPTITQDAIDRFNAQLAK